MSCIVLWIGILCISVFGDGLFEKAAGAGGAEKNPLEINGYVRGTVYEGKVPDKDETEMKSGYGEAGLKLRVRREPFGDGYAEVRYRYGYEFGLDVDEVDLREAYVNAYAGPVDVRIGKQIVVWGRADGINPTNNITPADMLVRSPDEDDRRKGNFLVRSNLTFRPLRFEAIWVPFYRSSVLPIHMVEFPDDADDIIIKFGKNDYPDANLENSAVAVKASLELAGIDGSVSWFSGYNPFPGFDSSLVGSVFMGRFIPDSIYIIPRAWRTQIIGLDFSTTVGSLFGLRGEAALKLPSKDHEKNVYVPNPDLYYVLGVDKEYGDFNMIIQYVGRQVFDFTEIPATINMIEQEIQKLEVNNRMFAFQRDETSSAVFLRLGWKLLHETLKVDFPAMYNFTTEELMLGPRLAYDLTDALTATAGGEIYSGPAGTLFDIIEERLGAGFVELKASF
jgi:hypothetical protein